MRNIKDQIYKGGIPSLAEELGLSASGLYRQAQLKKLPFIRKINSRYIILIDELNDWLEKLEK